jgi:hypothetical protein
MTSQNQYSDEEIRLYLLGKLTRDRREQLEAHLLSDPTLHDELVAAEDDLVDDYLTRKLSDQERQQFETAFAITAQRLDKVEFGRTFQQYLESRQIADPQEDPGGDFAESPPLILPLTESRFFGRKSAMPMIVATLVLVLFLGVVAGWWLAFNRTVPKSHRPTIAVSLRPGTTRSSGESTPKIDKPPTNALVGFKLELGRSEFRKYRAELLRETESLAAFESLAAQATDNHFEVEVIVDASLFEESDGDYRFKLSGVSDSGHLVPAEEYGFRVNR